MLKKFAKENFMLKDVYWMAALFKLLSAAKYPEAGERYSKYKCLT